MSFGNEVEVAEALGSLMDEGWISEVLFEVKSGKEATVYCCARYPGSPNRESVLCGEMTKDIPGSENQDTSAGTPALRAGSQQTDETRRTPGSESRGTKLLIAAKVHRAVESRRFKNDAIYQTGRMHLARNGRVKRAAQNKSDFGRKIQYAMWLEHEWETMNLLFAADADVPKPLARNEHAILMPYLGDEESPALNLNEAELDAADVVRVTDRLLWNIELMLHHDRVHGDLSPFNVLYWNGRAIIIDFPQAIDPRLNPAARTLLERDIENICRWAAKRGIQRDAGKITQRLWSRFVLGEIG